MNEIEQIQTICSRYRSIQKVTLFGSRARGDNEERSDYDIAIYTSTAKNNKFKNDIGEINTLLKIDMTFISPNNNLDKVFLENIKHEEKVIYLSKFEKRYRNFIKAVQTLEEGIFLEEQMLETEQPDGLAKMLRDSLIQRFEYTYELSWKTLKEFLLYLGIEGGNYPRGIFALAYQNELINDEEVWLSMLSSRNVSSHEYSEDEIEICVSNIRTEYREQFRLLADKMKEVYEK